MEQINEISKKLNVKPYVLRYWKSEFNLTNASMSEFEKIKEMLWIKKMTIMEVKKELSKQ